MNDKKQIEEMALTLSEGGCGNECDCIQGDKFNCHLLYSASVLYDAGYRKQEWISVDERLPETNRDCLLLLDTEEIVIGYCRRDLHAFVEGGIVLVKDVTHWMPLPEPPKMKGGAE